MKVRGKEVEDREEGEEDEENTTADTTMRLWKWKRKEDK